MPVDEIMTLQEFVEKWLFDPVVGKLISAALLIVVVLAVVRCTQHALGRYVDDAQRRYRLRKLVTFFG